tara:strand:+ start:4135 stop:4932 length:798 start_codon:yes stop_codon:yes gene_type:complete
MKHSGVILKMNSKLNNFVEYDLPIGDNLINMNKLIDKKIYLNWNKNIFCIACNRKTNKSFFQGFCYPCFINSPLTSECILRPHLCQAQDGIARDIEWAEQHCLKDHYVYLAISSNIKVGVTRKNQIPTRWIDQGAYQAIKFAKTPNRYLAGAIEINLKEIVSDRTQWQRMLKNEVNKEVNLLDKKKNLLNHLDPIFKKYVYQKNNIIEINYPVKQYPTKVKSVSFEKNGEISGKLYGIKGQYLIFENGNVLNIRKHNGYDISLKT